MAGRLARIELHLLKVPLTAPYRLSFVDLHHVDALVVEAFDEAGRGAIGESTIQPGYTHETLEGAWNFIVAQAQALIGLPVAEAERLIAAAAEASPNAASALATAVTELDAGPLPDSVRVPLLAPVHGEEGGHLVDEIEGLLAQGYRTLKVKAGFDLAADLRRVAAIQAAVGGRAALRIDANGGFSRQQALSFAARLDPVGIELLEQPCAAEDWEANAAVARISPVPLMLDESIYGPDDIDRAAGLPGVRLIKLKLKKIGAPKDLATALARIRGLGLTPVLGDGTGTDIAAWHEAAVAALAIDNAGEMNGFLKIARPLLKAGPRFHDGHLEIAAGLSPALDPEAVSLYRVRQFVATAEGQRGVA